LPGHLGGISIQMIDLQGVVWYSDIDSLTSSETINIGIDIQNLPKGLYCLRISGSQGVAVRKIVVQ
jgi:hypothetical protein